MPTVLFCWALLVAIVDSGDITVWETKRWTQTAHFTDDGTRFTGACFLSGSRALVLGNDKRSLSLWDSKSSKRQWSSGPMNVNAFALHPAGNELYVNICDSTVIEEINPVQ
jgi:WD40 repeat protein